MPATKWPATPLLNVLSSGEHREPFTAETQRCLLPFGLSNKSMLELNVIPAAGHEY